MTDKILLTVVVTVYNLEEYLPKTLESVLSIPAELPYEVIAVDDGSKDRSPEILREWEATHDRLRVIVQKNSGASGARNTGIEAAKGKYITFVDGDDTIHIDENELRKAEWVSRKDITGQPNPGSMTHEMMIWFRDHEV